MFGLIHYWFGNGAGVIVVFLECFRRGVEEVPGWFSRYREVSGVVLTAWEISLVVWKWLGSGSGGLRETLAIVLGVVLELSGGGFGIGLGRV